MEDRDIHKIHFQDKEYDLLAVRTDNNSGILIRDGLIYGMNIGIFRLRRIKELDGKDLSEMVEYLDNL